MRIVNLCFLIVLGCLLAGIYGALYEQIAYSISPEFFTKYRFPLFHLEASMGRTGAAVIGFLVTWKIGLVIGVVLASVGLITKDRKRMFRYTFQAFMLTLFIAFITGMIGYSVSPLAGQRIPDGDLLIEDVVAFQTVENMNNFSYAGGVIGMFLGIFYQVYRHKKIQVGRESIPPGA